MGFLVSEKNNKAATPIVDDLGPTTATDTYTMSVAPASEEHILVYLGGVQQMPGAGNAYTVSGTDLVFASATDTGLTLVVIHGAYDI
jgi:hypothetical protein